MSSSEVASYPRVLKVSADASRICLRRACSVNVGLVRFFAGFFFGAAAATAGSDEVGKGIYRLPIL
jgi:hypothetical protein